MGNTVTNPIPHNHVPHGDGFQASALNSNAHINVQSNPINIPTMPNMPNQTMQLQNGFSLPGSFFPNSYGPQTPLSVDDGSIEARVKAMVAPEAENFTVPSQPNPVEPVTTVFRWSYGGKEVAVTGSFTNWEGKIDAVMFDKDEFIVALSLLPGTYHYRFIVDGQWKVDPLAPQAYIQDVLCNVADVQPPVMEHMAYGAGPEDGYDSDNDLVEGEQQTYGHRFPKPEDYSTEPIKIPPHLVHKLPLNQDLVHLTIPSHVILNHIFLWTPLTANVTKPIINPQHPSARDVHIDPEVLNRLSLSGVVISSVTQRLKASKGIRKADRYVTTIYVAPKRGSTLAEVRRNALMGDRSVGGRRARSAAATDVSYAANEVSYAGGGGVMGMVGMGIGTGVGVGVGVDGHVRTHEEPALGDDATLHKSAPHSGAVMHSDARVPLHGEPTLHGDAAARGDAGSVFVGDSGGKGEGAMVVVVAPPGAGMSTGGMWDGDVHTRMAGEAPTERGVG